LCQNARFGQNRAFLSCFPVIVSRRRRRGDLWADAIQIRSLIFHLSAQETRYCLYQLLFRFTQSRVVLLQQDHHTTHHIALR